MLQANEYEFIKQKISEVDSNYKVIFVPKSLYQLCYILFLFEQLRDFSLESLKLDKFYRQLEVDLLSKKITANEYDRAENELDEERNEIESIFKKWSRERRKFIFDWSPSKKNWVFQLL